MRRLATGRLLTTVALLLALPALTRAADYDDEPEDEQDEIWRVDGTVRAGWRFLSGRGRGRFLQDINLDSGARIFDVDAHVEDLREESALKDIEVRATDLGERETDASIVARSDDGLRVEGGYARDLFTYRADGDPFPRDTTRNRSYARLRYAPRNGLTFRVDWERSERSGEAFAQQLTSLRELPAPPGVDQDIVSTVRPFDETFDTYTLGADASEGPWRFGATVSYRRGDVDDERHFRVPAADRGSAPVSEDFDRHVDSHATTAVGKAGRTFLDGAAEVTLFVTQTWLPVDADLDSQSQGYDNSFDGATPRGAFTSSMSGENNVHRRGSAWELDGSWQVLEDVEILASGGQEDLIDDADLDTVENRRYERNDVANETIRTRTSGRTTNRVDRASVETLWDVHEDVTLRTGYEWFKQDTKAPFETQGDRFDGSRYSSTVHRIIAGVDADLARGLNASVLARLARDDHPPSTPSYERADEVTGRVRWRADERLSMTASHRYRGLHHEDDLDSVTEVNNTSLRATWSDGPLVIQGGATRQVLHTESDTTFYILDGFTFRRVADEVTYDTREVITDLHAEYELRENLRLSAGGNYVKSTGDTELTAYEAFSTLAVDVSTTVTLGLTGRIWHYDDRDGSEDDYDAEALEVWLELRF